MEGGPPNSDHPHTLSGLMRRPFRLLALSSVLACTCLVPAAAAQTAQPAPAVETSEKLAKEAFQYTQLALDLEARLPQLEAALAKAEAEVGRNAGGVSDEKRRAAELLVQAKRLAIDTYLRGDSTSNTYAVINAMAQENKNDAAWRLGLIQVSNRRTLDLMQAARARGVTASRELTDALSARDQAKDAILRLKNDAQSYRSAADAVSRKLQTVVVAQAPIVVGSMTTVAYEAYRRGAAALASERPACGLRWELLAAIGKTESDHGMGRLDSTGRTNPIIRGIPIGKDSDGGKYDESATVDHAVGPMQFIPQTWVRYATDGNGDGISDINNIYDEALAAARYLCVAAGSLTLNTKEGVTRAILAYNPNQEYLRTVGGRFEALAQDVARGWFSAAGLPEAPPPVEGVDPGGATGGAPPTSVPPVVPTPNTRIVEVALFGTNSVTAAVTSPTPVDGECSAPSAKLSPRLGPLTCTTASPAATLDPCFVAPYDTTIVVCLSDPTAAGTLVKVAAPLPPSPVEQAPPYLAIDLSATDRCLPIAAAATAAPTTTTTTTTTVAATTTTAVTSSSSSVAAAPIQAPSQTQAPATYRCGSGAELIGQPAVTATFWTITVRQSGIADRSMPIATVYR